VLVSDNLHADETPIKVLDKDKKGEIHRGYFWVYHNSLQDIAFFDYQSGRSREGPSVRSPESCPPRIREKSLI
jgi:transposase